MKFNFQHRAVKYIYVTVVVLILAFLAGKYAVFPSQLRFFANEGAARVGQNLSPFKSYASGRVEAILEEKNQDISGIADAGQKWQLVSVRLSGEDSGGSLKQAEFLSQNGSIIKSLSVGDRVVVAYVDEDASSSTLVVVDRYRMPGLFVLAFLFLAILFWVARWRGLLALAGLLFSLAVLLLFIGPGLVLGRNASVVIIGGVGVIAIVSSLLAHGWNYKALVGAVSNLCTVLLAFGLSHLAIWILGMAGLGSDEVYYLNSALLGTLNTKGVLLASIVVGSLGALDDVTATQAAAVDVIYKTGDNLSVRQVFARGMMIGREHVSALVNTLILVYASVALPFILLLLLTFDQPLWVILNSETVAEELVRALVGGAVVILAVPVTTALAAWTLKSRVQVDFVNKEEKRV